MTHHQHAKDSSIHNAEAWLDHPRVQTDAYFQQIYALPAPSSKKRQRSETTGTDTATREVCRKFNSQTGCSYRNCKQSLRRSDIGQREGTEAMYLPNNTTTITPCGPSSPSLGSPSP